MKRRLRPGAEIGRGLPLVGVLPQLLRDPSRLATQAMLATDHVVPLRLGPVTAFLAHHPEHLRHVLVDNYRNYEKGPLFAPASLVFGEGLVLREGEAWARQRKVMAQPFGAQRIRGLVPGISHVVSERLARWGEDDAAREMGYEMSRITMSVLLRALFGIPIGEPEVENVITALETMVGYLSVRGPLFFLSDGVPLPGRRRALEAREELRAIVDDAIAKRRDSKGDDLIGYLQAARYEGGEAMPHELLRDEVIAMIFGGYDTTATGLAFTLHLLASHPELMRRGRAEALRVAPREALGPNQVDALDFIRRTFLDAIRLHPPFSFHPRVALRDDRIGAQRIPAGATVLCSNAAAGRNPAFWDHPDSFHPDHFLPEQVARRHPNAFAPFGAGPRACIGRQLAALEATVVLALVLRDFELARPVHPLVVRSRFGPSRAQHGVWIRVRRASTAGAG